MPFFYIIFWKKLWPINKNNIQNFLLLNLGMLFFISMDVGYNFLRFGDINPFSPYNLIPNIFDDPRFKDGFMNIKYIPLHIDATLFRLPKLTDTFPFIIPSLYGMAIWFVSPAVVYIFKTRKTLINLACWAAIITVFSIIFLWPVVGFAQFGYRFAQDVMPFLLILIAFGIGQKPSKWAYALVFLSVLVNTWGTLSINKFHIFTF